MMLKIKKKILFITGTRADYGKIKSLINVLNKNQKFEVHLFVTGMHLVEKFGYTVEEVKKEKAKLTTIFSNSSKSEEMDIMLSETIVGLSKQIKKQPDLIIIHGDRVETWLVQ